MLSKCKTLYIEGFRSSNVCRFVAQAISPDLMISLLGTWLRSRGLVETVAFWNWIRYDSTFCARLSELPPANLLVWIATFVSRCECVLGGLTEDPFFWVQHSATLETLDRWSRALLDMQWLDVIGHSLYMLSRLYTKIHLRGRVLAMFFELCGIQWWPGWLWSTLCIVPNIVQCLSVQRAILACCSRVIRSSFSLLKAWWPWLWTCLAWSVAIRPYKSFKQLFRKLVSVP